jgi:hypothetical protein
MVELKIKKTFEMIFISAYLSSQMLKFELLLLENDLNSLSKFNEKFCFYEFKLIGQNRHKHA